MHRINLKVRQFCAFAKITVMPLDKKGRKKDRFTEIQCNQVDLMCIQLSHQYKLGKALSETHNYVNITRNRGVSIDSVAETYHDSLWNRLNLLSPCCWRKHLYGSTPGRISIQLCNLCKVSHNYVMQTF